MNSLASKTALQAALDELERALSIAEAARRPGNENLVHLRASFEDVLAEVRALPTRPIEQAELKLAAAAATAGDLLTKIATDAGPGEAAIHGRFRQPVLKLLRELAAGHDANAPDAWRDVLHNGIGGAPPDFSQSELGQDAKKWAEAFVKTIYHLGCRHTHDVGFMLGWFSNAIEYGHQAKESSQAIARSYQADGDYQESDYLDSGMPTGARGTPYTMDEVAAVVATMGHSPRLDDYHGELLKFLVRRVNRLEAERVKDLNVMSTQGQEIERLRASRRIRGADDRPPTSTCEHVELFARHGGDFAPVSCPYCAHAIEIRNLKARGIRGIDAEARVSIAALKSYADLTVRRYQRLRVLGAAPGGSKHLDDRTVLCFQNLDDYLDADLKAQPSRGEAPNLMLGATLFAGGRDASGKPVTAENARAAEVVFDATELRVEAHETRQAAQNLILQADDAMNRAIMALRLEVPASIADEIAKRYHTVYRAYARNASLPSHELVALRHFHENVTAFARECRAVHLSTTYVVLEKFVDDVLTNSGQALMKPAAPDVTRRADGAYTAGPPPGGKTVNERLDELTGHPIPRATEPANQCRHVDEFRGDRCILRLGHEGNGTERGVHVFGTPHYDRFTQPTIEAAKRVAEREIDVRMENTRSGTIVVLIKDIEAFKALVDVVSRLNIARSKGDHQ